MNDPNSTIIVGDIYNNLNFSSNDASAPNRPGGTLLYSAAGLGIWNFRARLLSKISEDFPLEWLDKLDSTGFKTEGINIETFPENGNLYPHGNSQSFNKNLHKLSPPHPQITFNSYKINKTKNKLKANNIIFIPESYNNISHLLLCPNNIINQSYILNRFSSKHLKNVFLASSSSYMRPYSMNELSILLKGISAFFTTEKSIRSLYQGITSDICEMAESLSQYGCNSVIISFSSHTYQLYDHITKEHWLLPAYPVKYIDNSCYFDSFTGGYMAGYINSYDPIEALISGSISGSFASEVNNPFYLFNILPSLANARADYIRPMLRKL